MAAIPNVKLNSGKEMPLVGFGLWKVPNDVCADVVYNAIKVGYRLFDGACGASCAPSPALPPVHLSRFYSTHELARGFCLEELSA